MIDYPIIDTHLHLWDIKKLRYPWLVDIPVLNKTFSLVAILEGCSIAELEKVFIRNALDFYRI